MRHALSALLLVAVAAPAWSQEQKAEGQLTLGRHSFDLKAGMLYEVVVTAESFSPFVDLVGGIIRTRFDFAANKRNTFQGTFLAKDSKEHTFTVAPGFIPDYRGPLTVKYTFTIKPIDLDPTPLLQKKDALTAADPAYKEKKNTKSYTLPLKKGRTVIIDMVRDSKDVDPYLYLENPKGMSAASDDDGGGDYNSRIIFTVPEDGDYKLIASSLTGLGGYTVTVRGTK